MKRRKGALFKAGRPGLHQKCTGSEKTIDWDYPPARQAPPVERLRLVAGKKGTVHTSSGQRPTPPFPEAGATVLQPARSGPS